MILSGLLLVPLIGIALLLLVPARFGALLRGIAMAAAAAALVYAGWLYAIFTPGFADIQFYESHIWNSRLGTAFVLAVDGISLAMMLLVALLFLVALLISEVVQRRVKRYHILVLSLEAGALGVLLARDWSTFFIFWQGLLVLVFLLLAYWGGEERRRAALNFFVYAAFGSVFILGALLALYDAVPSNAFEMTLIQEGGRSLSEAMQATLLATFLVGFAISMAAFPLQAWLLPLCRSAPMPILLLLLGVVLSLAAYGLIRVAGLLPAGIHALQLPLFVIGLLGVFYGGVQMWRQLDLRAVLAYLSITAMGWVMIGLAALNVAGILGAVVQLAAHGLALAALIFLLHRYERHHPMLAAADWGAPMSVLPRFAILLALAIFLALGLPGSGGFVAVIHLLLGGYWQWGGWIALAGAAALIGAAYLVRLSSQLWRTPGAEVAYGSDLSLTETAAAIGLLACGIGLGLYPTPFLELLAMSARRLTQLFAS